MFDSELGAKSQTNIKLKDFKQKMTAKTIEDLSAIDDNTVTYIEYNNQNKE